MLRSYLVAVLGLVGCARDHKLETIVVEPTPRSFETETADASRLAPGTVFFSDNSDINRPRIVEVDRDGSVVWQAVIPPAVRQSSMLMDAEPTPSGGAAFIVDGIGAFEVDEAGELVRSFESFQPSHDIDVLPDDSWLLTNGWSLRGEVHFMEIDPTGRNQWSWDGLDYYDSYPYTEVYSEGWIHANAAQRLDDGTTLVSLRNFNEVALLDAAGAPSWSVRFDEIDPELALETPYHVAEGRNPHDPELTDAGTVLMALHRPERVVEVDPVAGELVWSWLPLDDRADGIRDANRLPNGNTLVTAAETIFEVSPEGEILWTLSSNEENPEENTAVRSLYKAMLIDDDGEVHGG